MVRFYEPEISQESFSLGEKYIVEPFKIWLDFKIQSAKHWLKFNLIDLFCLIAVVIIVSIGLKILLYHNKEKDFPIIYITVVSYVVIRLFWRVVFHV